MEKLRGKSVIYLFKKIVPRNVDGNLTLKNKFNFLLLFKMLIIALGNIFGGLNCKSPLSWVIAASEVTEMVTVFYSFCFTSKNGKSEWANTHVVRERERITKKQTAAARSYTQPKIATWGRFRVGNNEGVWAHTHSTPASVDTWRIFRTWMGG